MPYGNYFPASYQPTQYYQQFPYVTTTPATVPQNQLQQPQPQPAATSGIIWVQGEAGAKSYLVAPNTTVQLWDSERQTIYIKSADASGMPSIKTLDYTIREIPQNSVSLAPESLSTAFATKDEVNLLAEQLEALKGKIDGLTAKPAGRQRKETADNE